MRHRRRRLSNAEKEDSVRHQIHEIEQNHNIQELCLSYNRHTKRKRRRNNTSNDPSDKANEDRSGYNLYRKYLRLKHDLSKLVCLHDNSQGSNILPEASSRQHQSGESILNLSTASSSEQDATTHSLPSHAMEEDAPTQGVTVEATPEDDHATTSGKLGSAQS